MAAIDLIPIGSTDDAETIAYQNKLTIRKADTFLSLGAKSGILDGWGISTVAGQMQLSLAVGSGMVAARDGSQVEQKWGYIAQTRTATTVTFTAASAANRSDALVFAACDPQEAGTFPGTGALAAGGHLVAVPGVSGTTTPRTDAQIATYLGSGGFHRIADVLIPSGSTQISSGNITFTGFNIGGWNNFSAIPFTLTAASGWSITSAKYKLDNLRKRVSLDMLINRTGGTLTANSGGNLSPDVDMTTNWPSSLMHASTNDVYMPMHRQGVITYWGRVDLATTRLVLTHLQMPSETLTSGTDVRVLGDYYLDT